MNSAPFPTFPPDLTWPQIPSTVTLTIGSLTGMGGSGIIGHGGAGSLQAMAGPGSLPGDNAPVPVAVSLQGGVTGVAYYELIGVQGGTAPYSFAVTSGSLPAGLTLGSATGAISGTPTAAGTSDFTITVTDLNALTGSQPFSIVIAAPAASGGGSYVFIA